ncbi:hypothetical protein CDL15_Pgr022298 [Punica granatum]|uniref:Uncharacterized protein n=1 Tax=Punica granatum TaxID=22663 RepID=A0A218WME4_PUNGR|nr:hypothetical protein CDL15_Pgr022298 [Punica granatum]
MAPTYFPLRWESTRDQWWYASPIDWAAANGHYDLVRELLKIDNNHLFKLTSLRRIRRLETVWDDEAQFHDVARFRFQVARKLLVECESNKGKNSLIGAGYGGWLMYTAASAGDLGFIQELLERDPLLVFGEGEYGVTDIFYAAARSKNCEVFRVLYDFAVSPRFKGGEFEEEQVAVPSMYRREMMNRAVHAAARGGNLVILKELLGECDDVLGYRDVNGSTVLHAAAGKGQVEVVKYLMESNDLLNSTDNNGNTALHLAAHKGQLATVRVLVSASPALASVRNNAGETFLHMAVSGFHSPAFRRLDRQMELVKALIHGQFFNIEDVINVRSNEGRTPLHVAIVGNLHAELAELLMTVRSINVNVRDNDGMTPLDLLKQRPKSASSDILIRHLISAGAMFGIESKDSSARKAIASHLRMQSCGGSSPGTNFGVSDSEILLYTGIENPSPFDGNDPGSSFDSTNDNSCSNKKSNSVIRKVFQWPRTKEKSLKKPGSNEEIPTPVPLRQRFSKPSYALPSHKRTLSVRSDISSPTNRKKLATGIRQGVIESLPHLNLPRRRTPSSSFSRSSVSSTPTSVDKQKGLIFFDQDFAGPSYSNSVRVQDDDTPKLDPKRVSFGKRLRAQYFCFGGPSLSIKKPVSRDHVNPGYKCPVPSVA